MVLGTNEGTMRGVASECLSRVVYEQVECFLDETRQEMMPLYLCHDAVRRNQRT